MQWTRSILQVASVLVLVLFGAVACDKRPVPSQKIIAGEALLSEPLTLAAGSRLQVTLEDVSRADIAAQPLAELEQDAKLPLTFALAYNPNLILANMRYNLRARIVDRNGKLLWTTDSPQPLPLADAAVTLELVPTRTPATLPQSLFFQCEKQTLLVKIEGDSASLFLGERVFALQRMMSASGLHYQSEEADFWSKGDEAILTLAGESRRHCTLQPQALSLALAAQQGSTLWAAGNEPPWHLIRSSDNTLTLTRHYGKDILTLKDVVARTIEAGATQLEADSDEGKLALVLRKQKCTDTMSGQEYTLTVNLQFAEKVLQGCGEPLSWPMTPRDHLSAAQ